MPKQRGRSITSQPLSFRHKPTRPTETKASMIVLRTCPTMDHHHSWLPDSLSQTLCSQSCRWRWYPHRMITPSTRLIRYWMPCSFSTCLLVIGRNWISYCSRFPSWHLFVFSWSFILHFTLQSLDVPFLLAFISTSLLILFLLLFHLPLLCTSSFSGTHCPSRPFSSLFIY